MKYCCPVETQCSKIPDITIFCPSGLQGLVETLVRQTNRWCSNFKADSWGINRRRGEPRSTASGSCGPIHSAKWCLVTSLLARLNKKPVLWSKERKQTAEQHERHMTPWKATHFFWLCKICQCSCFTAASMSAKDAEGEMTTDEVTFHKSLFKFSSTEHVCEPCPAPYTIFSLD